MRRLRIKEEVTCLRWGCGHFKPFLRKHPGPPPSLLRHLASVPTEAPLYPCPGPHPELRATGRTSALCLGLFHCQVCGCPGCSSLVLRGGGSECHSPTPPGPLPQPQQGIPDPPLATFIQGTDWEGAPRKTPQLLVSTLCQLQVARLWGVLGLRGREGRS